MVVVENPVGRLVTLRLAPPVDDSDTTRAVTDVRATLLAIGRPVVGCVDVSECGTFSPEATEKFVAVMKSGNQDVERSAVLLSEASATFMLQMERILRAAASPARRTFRDRRSLREWLRPLLSPDERAALERFLENSKRASVKLSVKEQHRQRPTHNRGRRE